MIYDLSKRKFILTKTLSPAEVKCILKPIHHSYEEHYSHVIKPHFSLINKYLLFDEPNAGLLTEKAVAFLKEKSPAVQTGIKILQKFHDRRYIKNKYRLIKFTKPDTEVASIYEKVHARVKSLSGLKLTKRQKKIVKSISS